MRPFDSSIQGSRPKAGAVLVLAACLQPLLGVSGPLPECPPIFEVQGSAAGEAPPKAADSLSVVSLNTHGETRSDVFLSGLRQHAELRDADLILLQEFVQDAADLLGRTSSSLNYHYAFASTQNCGQDCRLGLAILSRYPLRRFRVLSLPRNDLQYNQRCRIALAAELDTPLGAWAVFNLHLDTRVNADRRVRQLGPVFETAASTPSVPTLIAGDFNTADLLWIKSVVPLPWLQLQKRAVRKAMESWGFWTPFAKTGFTFNRFPLKLDWIYLKGLEPIRFGLTRLTFSDHKALWAVLKPEGPTSRKG